jgi:hypothetical protein
MRVVLLLMLSLVLLLAGCAGIIGYEPTEAEAEAIARGEDPRADEDAKREAREAANPGGGAGEARQPRDPSESGVGAAAEQKAGPERGTVLRWMDVRRVVIEADGNREVVVLPEDAPGGSLDERMNKWTYGTEVRLRYGKDAQGKAIYRDELGRLLATIE